MMIFVGITTNNLKNVDVKILPSHITLIDGPSGSGKSSLAFDTIARICQDEFLLMSNENCIKGDYRVKSYSDLLPAVAIKQQNFNVNPRSSIMSYFGLEPSVIDIFCFFTALPPTTFVINDSTKCDHCGGTGYIVGSDVDSCIDSNLPVAENPFICWKGVFEPFFKSVLIKYCVENRIDTSLRFFELPQEQQNLLLNGHSVWKQSMKFRVNGYWCSRTWGYMGVEPFLKKESKKGVHKFEKIELCPYCHGSKLTKSILSKPLFGGSTIESFLTHPFSQLLYEIEHINTKNTNNRPIENSLSFLADFLKGGVSLNLGHLSLSRSIPTLSGGELQRLKMIPLLSGKIKNICIVLDEPTQSLYPSESLSLIPTIKKLGKQNAVILVDHNKEVQKIADSRLLLGPGSGEKGGYFVKQLGTSVFPKFEFFVGETHSEKRISSNFVNFSGSLKILTKTLIGVCGKSGVGKSVLLKTILPRLLPDYLYIDQKPIKGNVNSTVATLTGLFDDLKITFSTKFRMKPSDFSYLGVGGCKKCHGTGHLFVGDFDGANLYETCDKCNGTRYSEKISRFQLEGKSISDCLSMTIDALQESNILFKKKSQDMLHLLSDLGLGHLVLNQPISSLSGGENQRLKLCFTLLTPKLECIGLDEPSKGLDDESLSRLISVLYSSVRRGKTIYCIDHNPLLLSFCSYLIELQKNEQNTEIVYEGQRSKINACSTSDIKNYLKDIYLRPADICG